MSNNLDKSKVERNNDRTDRRIIKTKRAIHKAFMELITSKAYKDITVKDIAELADVNRKTFYNHYNDITELIDEIENEVVKSFDEAMEGINIHATLQDSELLCQRLLLIIEKCSDMCEHIMKIEYDGKLVNKLSAALENSIRKSSGDQITLDDDTVHFLMMFAVAGMLQTYQVWFNSDRSETIESVTRRLSEAVANGINGLRRRNGIQ